MVLVARAKIIEGLEGKVVLVRGIIPRIDGGKMGGDNLDSASMPAYTVYLRHYSGQVIQMLQHVLADNTIKRVRLKRPGKSIEIMNDVSLGFRTKIDPQCSLGLLVSTTQMQCQRSSHFKNSSCLHASIICHGPLESLDSVPDASASPESS